MNDDVQPPDTPSEPLQAVSAALDGTATPQQLAMVQASSELTVQLEEFRAARDQLRAVPVPAAAREAAVAAALAAFDDLGSGAALAAASPVAPTNVVSLDSRRRWYRKVAGAAAVVVLLAGVAAAIGSSGGSDDDSGDATAATASQKSSDDAASDAAGGVADAATAPQLATEIASASLPAPDSTESPAATDAPMAAPDAAPTETTTAPTIGEILVPADSTPVIDDPQALASFVAGASSTRDLATSSCIPAGDDDFGVVRYSNTPAVVGRHPADGLVTVYAQDGCAVLTTIDT